MLKGLREVNVLEINNLKKVLKRALPSTIVSSLILFINVKFFGMRNVIIAPYMALTFVRMRNYAIVEKNEFSPLFLHLIIGIFASLVSRGIWSEAFINLFGIIILVYLLTDEYNPNSYFPYLMAFVFLQVFPIEPSEMPKRILAIITSYLIVYVALRIVSPKGEVSKIESLINAGFDEIISQIDFLIQENGSEVKENQFKLFNIVKELNRLVYLGNKHKYYQFIVAFQQIINIIDDFSSSSMIKDNKKCYKNMKELFVFIKNNLNDITGCEREIYSFRKNSKFNNANLKKYVDLIMDYLLEAIKHMNCKKFSLRKFLNFNNKKDKEYFEVYSKYNYKLNQFKLRFATRISILITLSFLVVRLFHLEKGYWLPMTIFLLEVPFYSDSKKRVWNRFRGTAMGTVVALILFAIFKTPLEHVIIIIIATFFKYTFKNYGIMSIYITCYALGISTMTMNEGAAGFYRLGYTGIAAILVLFANKFIFPNKNHSELNRMIRRLVELDNVMINKCLDLLNGVKYDVKNEEIDIRRIIYSSYLISSRLQMHNDSVDDILCEDLKKFMVENSEFLASITSYCIVLNNSNFDNNKEDYSLALNGVNILKEIGARLKCNDSFDRQFEVLNDEIKSFRSLSYKDNYKNYSIMKTLDKLLGVKSILNNIYKEI
ncbi:FUSC family protein [Clostridium sp. B9]|uniref:FUSC family protein n=1 Tax=Clostridium sp. B9 TaxID=3423224 RepID=UPI003D2EFF27